jgi:hypothetical protein
MYFAPIGACEDILSSDQQCSINEAESTKRPFVEDRLVSYDSKNDAISAPQLMPETATRQILKLFWQSH